MSLVLMVCLFLLSSARADDNAGELAKIVSQLQSQVLALQESRTQDQETIRDLQSRLQRHFDLSTTESDVDVATIEPAHTTVSPITDVVVARVLSRKEYDLMNESNPDLRVEDPSRAIGILERESRSLSHLDSQLRELKDNIAEVVKLKEREITATDDITEFRMEADSLRNELLRVRRQVEEVKAKRREDEMAVRQAKNSQVTTLWLQETVEDLRREMTELASSVNISASLGQRQREQAGLDLVRYDITDLRKRLDSVHVAQERDTAWISQMKQDLTELRTKIQEVAAGHQKLVHEVTDIKEELQERKTIPSTEEKHVEEVFKDGPNKHHKRRHDHWRSEVEQLQNHVKNLNIDQSSLRLEVGYLKDSAEDMQNKITSLEGVSTNLVNKTSYLQVDQYTISRQMDTIQGQMDQQDRQSNNLKSIVNNITDSGIKKLHASTIQLFKTLETLENNYDKTIGDIRKEMSKMEFNLAQAQSTVTEIKEEQTSYEHTLKTMKTEVKRVEMESKRDHYRFLILKSDLINKTLQDSRLHHHDAMRQLKLTDLESRIATLTRAVDGERQEVDVLHKQIAEKADLSDISRWERIQDRLREIVLNVSGVLPKMNKEEQQLQNEMLKFVQQLPKDCSVPAGTQHSKSGDILIQKPQANNLDHPTPIRVYCDMETSGGEWLVIQRRSVGHQNFNQNWVQYKEGFGDIKADFWLGNELVHRLTTNNDYKLRIDFWDATGRYKYVEYETFRVLQESDGYRLAISGYSGNGSDAMGYHNGMSFSTPDRDNDASLATHCAQFYGSGWWYNHCQYVNINGRYSTGVTWYDINGQEWSELTKVEMKIKPITKKSGIRDI